MSTGPTVAVTGSFDDIRSKQIRFLEEASKAGALTVLLWNDQLIQRLTGKPPKFPQAERQYLLEAIRHVSRVILVDRAADMNSLMLPGGVKPDAWAVEATQDNPVWKKVCAGRGIDYRVLRDEELLGFPDPFAGAVAPASRKKVIVTGCYDWFHSGHVRFFEEVSSYGDVYAIVGHDANIRLLKGEGHPLVPEAERRYVVGSVRYVTQALVSTGDGWLDAEPEIRRIKPDIYAVNEDGDKGGKREFCQKNGIDYLVLKRTPAPGLPKRSSTDLRGF